MNPIDIAKLISEDINVEMGLLFEHQWKDIKHILLNQEQYGLIKDGIPLYPADLDNQTMTSLVAELNKIYGGKFSEEKNINRLAEIMKDLRKFHKSGPRGVGHSPGRLERGGYERRHPFNPRD